jgi:hypothetical protein
MAPIGGLPGSAAPAAPDRLMQARAALAAGRLEEGRQLLEQAQVQLVLRPVGPEGNSPGSSVAAGQVAEALSMLGAGDARRAVHYIDLAMAQTRGGQAGGVQPITANGPSASARPMQPGYGFGYGAPPGYGYSGGMPLR